MSGQEFWFALASVDGVGPMRIKRLLNRFGTIEAIFDAELSDIARIPLFNPLLATRILKARIRVAEFRRHIKWFKSRGIDILCVEEENYPSQLKEIPNAPAILCKKGNLSQVSEKTVAIVGATDPTQSGILTTLELSRHLAQAGLMIVSGLAKGIDTSAHLGALSANGTTIGVVGKPIYFRSTRAKIENSQIGYVRTAHFFPNTLLRPNRHPPILSFETGSSVDWQWQLSLLNRKRTVGQFATADFALEQGRLVFACNWKGHSRLSEGPRKLIQRGAYPISPDQLDKIVDVLSDPDCIEKIQSAQLTGEQMDLF